MVEPDGTAHHGRILSVLDVFHYIVTRRGFAPQEEIQEDGRASWQTWLSSRALSYGMALLFFSSLETS
jgi:hypothetical protein